MSEKCLTCRRIVSSGVWCDGCSSFFHWGDCSGVGNGEVDQTHQWFCRICSRDRKIVEQEGKIAALQAQLEQAREDLNRLRREKGKERWEVATGNRRNRPRTLSDSFVVNVKNKFDLLLQLETDEPQTEVGVERAQQTFSRKLNKNVGKSAKRKKVLLLGSSHARGVGQLLQDQLGSEYQVTNFFKPSAGLGQVTEDLGSLCKDFTKEDTVVIVGGPGNSIDRDPGYNIECDLAKIESATRHTSVEFVSVLRRHDRPHLNSSVGRVNLELEWLLGSGAGSHIGLVPVDSLSRWDYTRHGLHLNRKGKGKLAGLIAGNVRGGGTAMSGNIPVVIGVGAAPFLG